MLTIKKRVAPFSALILTILGPALFSGCADPGSRALLRGERLVRESKYAEAIPKLEQAARLLPRDARAWNHLGLAYHGGGRGREAAKAYQQALALDRNLAAAHFNLGCLHLEQNNVPAALADLISYTGLQPNAPDGWTKLGAAQLRAHQADAAEKSFRQALKLNTRSAEAWNGLGLAQVQRRHHQDACQQFNAALRVQPDYAPALLNAAIVSHLYLNGRELALEKYRQYLALQPQPPNSSAVQQVVNQLELDLHPPARNLPAQIASLPQPAAPAPATIKPPPGTGSENTNKPATALSTPSPAPPPQRTNLAASAPHPSATVAAPPPPAKSQGPPVASPKVEIVRLSEEEPIKLARDIAANSAPLSPDAPAPKSATARSAPDSRRTNARYRYRSPAAPQPGNRGEAERWFAQGVAAQERNRLSESLDAYRQATIADPSFFDAHYNRGVAAYEAGDSAQSLSAYEFALAINPASVKARFNFAAALQKANYPDDAANELERLLADNPSEARAHVALANLYAQQLGEPTKAREHYLRLLELEPQHPQATAIRYWLEANP